MIYVEITYLKSLGIFSQEFLDYLKENNIPRAIATMSEWDNVEFYIKEFRLEKWFDIDKIVYSDGTKEALNLGGYLDIGIIDTMHDLFVNLIGAVIFSIIGYLTILIAVEPKKLNLKNWNWI